MGLPVPLRPVSSPLLATFPSSEFLLYFSACVMIMFSLTHTHSQPSFRTSTHHISQHGLMKSHFPTSSEENSPALLYSLVTSALRSENPHSTTTTGNATRRTRRRKGGGVRENCYNLFDFPPTLKNPPVCNNFVWELCDSILRYYESFTVVFTSAAPGFDQTL